MCPEGDACDDDVAGGEAFVGGEEMAEAAGKEGGDEEQGGAGEDLPADEPAAEPGSGSGSGGAGGGQGLLGADAAEA